MGIFMSLFWVNVFCIFVSVVVYVLVVVFFVFVICLVFWVGFV